MTPKALSVGPLLPKSRLLTLDKINWGESGSVLEAHGPDRTPCPACLKVSHSRHSRYWRTLKDLPSHGGKVALKLQVNRWRCRNRGCSVRFFTRSLVGVVEAYARETNRARDLTLLIGHALGGLPGQRLMSRFNMATSDDTILRRLKHLPREPVNSEVRVMGVDEWAWSRGQTFGTILVDLERGRVVDVLAESSADALAAWLTAHPGVTTISRDLEAASPTPLISQVQAVSQPSARQISPQVAAALLNKRRPDLTARQAEIVDALKQQCPGYAGMRKLTFGFRAILLRGRITTLHGWLEEARRTGIHAMERFVRTVKQDLKAVESAVTERWSNGPVEGQINRLKALKRQMHGRAGVDLLRARVLPLPVVEIK